MGKAEHSDEAATAGDRTSDHAITPIFIFSLPRSGSTLTQRILGAHAGVATTSEPWILLPLLNPLRQDKAGLDSWQQSIGAAVKDFADDLPRGRRDYLNSVREMALSVYAKAASGGDRYFIDKTPGYFAILDEIVETFPDAKFVFLWRNPVSALASIVTLLCDDRWDTYSFRGTLFTEVEQLVEGWQRHRARSCAVRFEDLLDGTAEWERLARYLDLEFEPEALERFSSVELTGRYGDPTGTKRYQSISDEPLDKWRATVRTPLRRWWCKRYLHWIGEERLGIMGYDLSELLDELKETEVDWSGTIDDVAVMASSLAHEAIGSRVGGNGFPSSWRLILGR